VPQTFLSIRGIDPLLFRDGRPFTAAAGGLTASSLPLPFPTTVAAFVRTQIGRAADWKWSLDECRGAHGIPVHGPLLLRNGEVVLPAPRDALLRPVPDEPNLARPQRLIPREPEAPASAGNGGCDLPDGMWPVMPPLLSKESVGVGSPSGEAKPPKGLDYWTKADMLGWLDRSDSSDSSDSTRPAKYTGPETIMKIGGLPEEERIGIRMDSVTGKAKESQLYATRLRAFGENTDDGRLEYSLIAKVNLPSGLRFCNSGTLGGERRLTVIEPIDDTPEMWPRCPQSLKDALSTATRVRMILATPAHFEHGWKPGWIDKSGTGEAHLPAGVAKVKLKLVAAAVGRRVPVSGWGPRQDTSTLDVGQASLPANEQGPRPIRWLAPAGSVYFFVVDGDRAALWRDAWLEPMSDNEQDRRDGLGLALWGTW
jgi:CRISPR-associated protein Cmr3